MDTRSPARPRTRLAVLGTLSDLHCQPVVYDLECLRSLVAALEPDLLCAEVTPEVWESGDLLAAGIEVREALSRVASSTDVVLVPVMPTPQQFVDFNQPSGWQRILSQGLHRFFQWSQRKASRPEVINSSAFELFCHTVCFVIEQTWTAEDRRAWDVQNKIIVDNIYQAVRRDPGRRVLVAVQCQRLHQLVPLLKGHPDELEIVPYESL